MLTSKAREGVPIMWAIEMRIILMVIIDVALHVSGFLKA
jgi:hypothetical protein